MTKFLSLLVLISTISSSAMASILDIVETKGAITVYHENKGIKSYSVISKDGGKRVLMGYSSSIVVLQDEHTIYVLDEKGNTISTKSREDKNVVSVVGENYITDDGHWITKFDKKGFRISSKGKN